MKYQNMKQLPFRPRLTLALLYLSALAVTLTAGGIAFARGNEAGQYLCAAIEIVMVFHLLRRVG